MLVVEDERKIRDLVRGYLEREGLGVLTTESGAEAIALARASEPDLVILDLGLPDVPGEAVAREVRAFSQVPILMLTAKASEDDRIHGLELGADDYLTKPFSPRELVLRAKAILRRAASAADDEAPSSFGGGRLIVDEARREVHVQGAAVALTPTEFGVLVALARVPGRVYSRYELINRVRGYLEHEGLGVLTTESGAEAIALARGSEPDLLILDLRLPDVPGEEVAREVRTFSQVPILMLTAKASEEDRIRGLELGADDYLTKPFSPRELVLRAKAILRRGASAADDDVPSSFGGGRLIIDEARREARADGHPVALTPTEFGILLALARVPGRVYSRYELINRVRGYEFEGYERTIDSHVKNLRRKIERDPHDPHVVVTVLSGGYRLGVERDA